MHCTGRQTYVDTARRAASRHGRPVQGGALIRPPTPTVASPICPPPLRDRSRDRSPEKRPTGISLNPGLVWDPGLACLLLLGHQWLPPSVCLHLADCQTAQRKRCAPSVYVPASATKPNSSCSCQPSTVLVGRPEYGRDCVPRFFPPRPSTQRGPPALLLSPFPRSI